MQILLLCVIIHTILRSVNMGNKKCAIENCQNSTYGYYPLCNDHLAMIKTGEVIKDKNSKWRLKNNTWDNYNKEGQNAIENNEKKCLLCGEVTKNGYNYCKDCYYNIQDRMEELDKNQNPIKLKDYYYNAKDYAMRIYNEDKIYYQELTMIAITNLLCQLYNDDSLTDRLHKDIEKIEENLKSKNTKLSSKIKEVEKIDEIKANSDKDKAKIKKTQDGHFVESEFEIKVDDILFTNSIAHAYSVKVDEIFERTVICDWYIPVLPGKGIYIELWGVKGDEKYNKNKREKIELYKKNKLKLIEIEYDELKDNTQRLKSSLVSNIHKLEKEIKDN